MTPKTKMQLASDRAMIDAALRLNFHLFVRRVFQTLNPGTAFNDNWNLEAISAALEEVRAGHITRLVINVPPRSLKSLISSIAFPAWMLGHNPGARILCISHTSGLATDFSRQFRSVVTASWYRRLFPGTVFSKTSEDVLETTSGGARRAASIEGGLTGYGGEIILIDDPLDGSDAMSQVVREKVIQTFRGTIFQRLNNKATNTIVLIMQRLHEEDLSGYLLKLGYQHLCMPATATERAEYRLLGGRTHVREPGEILNVAQEPQSALDEIRAMMPARDYAAQYQQAPVPDTGELIKAEWIQRYELPPDLSKMRIVISWDTAVKGNANSDYTVGTVWGELNGKHYLLYVYRRQVTQHQQVRDVVELYNKYNPEIMLIESQGSGAGLADFLRQDYGIHTHERHAKDKKEVRMASASYFFEKRQVYFPRDASWLADLERELFHFPNSLHDDQADSISQYLNWSHERGSFTLKVHNIDDADEADVIEEIDESEPRDIWQVLGNLPRY
jgi:predicted phage terminase large subunit-like protein